VGATDFNITAVFPSVGFYTCM